MGSRAPIPQKSSPRGPALPNIEALTNICHRGHILSFHGIYNSQIVGTWTFSSVTTAKHGLLEHFLSRPAGGAYIAPRPCSWITGRARERGRGERRTETGKEGMSPPVWKLFCRL